MDISQSLLGNLKSFVGPSVGVKYHDGSTYLYGKVYAPSDGWYDWNDVTSTTYIGKGLFGNYGNVGAMEIRKLINYNISYNLDGGTAEGNPTTYNALSGTIALNPPTKEGYKFKGWTGSNGSTPQIAVAINGRETTGDLSYTAN